MSKLFSHSLQAVYTLDKPSILKYTHTLTRAHTHSMFIILSWKEELGPGLPGKGMHVSMSIFIMTKIVLLTMY